RKSMALSRLAGGQRHADAADVGRPELISALGGIPLRYRVVLALHYLMDLPVSEIAVELDLSVSTVKTRLARGRIRLRNHLIQQGMSAHD
ncbi:MAG: RNA polymerase sigma factor, partial [Angustibacter sp.]